MEVSIKLVIWNDSLICGSCLAGKMNEWEEIVTYAQSLDQCFKIIYLFTPKKEDLNRLNVALKTNQFDYPVFIDQSATFVKQNSKLPKNWQLHSFLLDKNNKVVLVGNPLHNPPLWELYKSIIQKLIVHDGVLPAE